MKIADSMSVLGIRTNADQPADAARARLFGARGIEREPSSPSSSQGR